MGSGVRSCCVPSSDIVPVAFTGLTSQSHVDFNLIAFSAFASTDTIVLFEPLGSLMATCDCLQFVCTSVLISIVLRTPGPLGQEGDRNGPWRCRGRGIIDILLESEPAVCILQTSSERGT